MSTHEKAVFGAREPSIKAAVFGAEDVHQQKYMGPERRHENRRSGHDRRYDVRFELSAEDRRQSHGRREGDNAPTFW